MLVSISETHTGKCTSSHVPAQRPTFKLTAKAHRLCSACFSSLDIDMHLHAFMRILYVEHLLCSPIKSQQHLRKHNSAHNILVFARPALKRNLHILSA